MGCFTLRETLPPHIWRLARTGLERLAAAVTLVAALVGAAPATATDVAEFYRGKSVNIIVGYGPGGGYDLFARMLARYMGAHIPGAPAMSVQNMPGAASLRAINHLATAAPKDGTVIAAFDRNMPLIAFVGGSPNVQFDPLKLTWLGTLSDSSMDAFVVWTRKRPDIQSVDDLLRPGGPTLTVGVAGVGATDNDVAVLLREVLGLRLRIVPGYQDSNKIAHAVEGGEVDGQLVNYITRKITHPAWADTQGNMQVLLQFARATRLPELAKTPTAQELAKDDAALQLIRMAELPYVVSRPFAAPPGIPADRAQALQTAFMNAAGDPAMVAEANKLQLDLTPLDARQTLAAVEELGRSSPELRKRIREILYAPK